MAAVPRGDARLRGWGSSGRRKVAEDGGYGDCEKVNERREDGSVCHVGG